MKKRRLTKDEKWEILCECVGDEETYRYQTAPFGTKLGLYQKGNSYHIAIGRSIGMEVDPKERPIVVIDCPGSANIPDPEYVGEEEVIWLREGILEAWEAKEVWEEEYEAHLTC
jgi:hypothetical protein